MFNSYFSSRFILSKKCLISLVLSDRSDGKTFDCKLTALEDYEENKEITVYMRRYKTEITEKLYNSFFDEVLQLDKYSKYREYEFKGSRKGIQIRRNKKEPWDYIILFVPLSVAGKLKSQISEVNRIKKIKFDEYIPLDGKYLPNEIDQLLEFWKTIDRDRDSTQLLILGNKITPFNPLFDYFDIELSITNEKVRLYRNNTLAVQIYSNKEHREKREEGKFKQLIKGTSYENYDNGGILNSINIKKMNRDGLNYYASFKTERGEGSIWYRNGIMLISEYCRKDGFIITDKIYNLDRQEFLCTFGNFSKTFKNLYKTGNLYFETEKAFYSFEKILTKIGKI